MFFKFGETLHTSNSRYLMCEKNVEKSDSSLKIWTKFQKDFLVKKISWEFFCKFSTGVPDQFMREFLYKITRINFTKDFLVTKLYGNYL